MGREVFHRFPSRPDPTPSEFRQPYHTTMRATAFTIFTPAAIANGASGGSSYGVPVDIAAPYCRTGKIVFTGKSSAGSSPTLAAKIQKSDPVANSHSMVSVAGDTEADQKSRNGTDTNIKLAAKFVVATGGKTISKVYLPLKKVGAPTGTITVTILADSGGSPTGSALATFATVSAASLTTSYVDTAFTLATPVDLAAGTYHIVLESDVSISATVYVAWGALTRASGGNANLFGTGWVPTATVDLKYRLWTWQFSDLTGGGFAGLTTVGSVQSLDVDFQTLSVVRPYFTTGGTSTPTFYVGIVGVAETTQS